MDSFALRAASGISASGRPGLLLARNPPFPVAGRRIGGWRRRQSDSQPQPDVFERPEHTVGRRSQPVRQAGSEHYDVIVGGGGRRAPPAPRRQAYGRYCLMPRVIKYWASTHPDLGAQVAKQLNGS